MFVRHHEWREAYRVWHQMKPQKKKTASEWFNYTILQQSSSKNMLLVIMIF